MLVLLLHFLFTWCGTELCTVNFLSLDFEIYHAMHADVRLTSYCCRGRPVTTTTSIPLATSTAAPSETRST